MVNKIQQAKKILKDLNKLDAQYLTDYPKSINRATYTKKRNILRNKMNSLK